MLTPKPCLAPLIATLLCGAAHAAQLDIFGPAGSGAFGTEVTVLPNGNFVVTDPLFDAPGPIVDAGAIYLYRADGMTIATTMGATAGDQLGNGGVTVLSNGNFVVTSTLWDRGMVVDAGLVTWCHANTGCASQSMQGSSANDRVGSKGVTPLTNGHYVIASPEWDFGPTVNAGAVTWVNGETGNSADGTGSLNLDNSLAGTQANDSVGSSGVTALSNGNYVVASVEWDNGAISNAGAVTWGDGAGDTHGAVATSNSLVGSSSGDAVGIEGTITALSNSHYVVTSNKWDNGPITNAGAVTWGNGNGGSTGAVGIANSLVGSTAGDTIGGNFATALSNGNYVFASPNWDNGATANTGAATWCNGSAASTGTIGSSLCKSLVGSQTGDRVGSSVTALSNGHYVVASRAWNNGALAAAGAATWGNGISGSSGVVGVGNSLVGGAAEDQVGSGGVTALTNGNYVVISPEARNPIDAGNPFAGAATWGNGSSGITGVVSLTNSLMGDKGDEVGSNGITALSNGHYVVASRMWNNGGLGDVGAVTWGNGNTGTVGKVSLDNSLVGNIDSDNVGSGGVTVLANGNYVVSSPNWNQGAFIDAGAVTWANGAASASGAVTAVNSLIGSSSNDHVGAPQVTAMSNGYYVINSSDWDNGVSTNQGAITLAAGNGSNSGALTIANSVIGIATSGGASMVSDYDVLRAQLVVGRPADDIVTLLRPGIATSLAIVSATPNPSTAAQAVTLNIEVSALSAPTTGTVSVVASSGESCTDDTPILVFLNKSSFTCQIVFSTVGARTLLAEFYGTQIHAYSRSTGIDPSHTVISNLLFSSGFE